MFLRGYTLIEILIVLVILSITISFALLSLGDILPRSQALREASLLSNYLKVAQDYAALTKQTYRLQIDEHGYQVAVWQDNRWRTINNLQKHYFSKKIIPIIRSHPPVYFTPQGEMDPLQVDFYTRNHQKVVTLKGQFNGKVFLQ